MKHGKSIMKFSALENYWIFVGKMYLQMAKTMPEWLLAYSILTKDPVRTNKYVCMGIKEQKAKQHSKKSVPQKISIV